MQLQFASTAKIRCASKNCLFLLTISDLNGYKKMSDFESRSTQFSHLYENLISFFSSYKLSSSNSTVLKVFSRPIDLAPIQSIF